MYFSEVVKELATNKVQRIVYKRMVSGTLGASWLMASHRKKQICNSELLRIGLLLLVCFGVLFFVLFSVLIATKGKQILQVMLNLFVLSSWNMPLVLIIKLHPIFKD